MLQVEGLMMDIAAAEEEITRWKVAAQQEAEAGKAVEQDYVAQVCWHLPFVYYVFVGLFLRLRDI